jgi:hypothetical protein
VFLITTTQTEIPLHCRFLPVSYGNVAAVSNNGDQGRPLCAALEVTLDAIANTAMRSMSGIVKRNLKRMSVDMAATISYTGDGEQEPKACVGMCTHEIYLVRLPVYFEITDMICSSSSGCGVCRIMANVLRRSIGCSIIS